MSVVLQWSSAMWRVLLIRSKSEMRFLILPRKLPGQDEENHAVTLNGEWMDRLEVRQQCRITPWFMQVKSD